METYSKEYVTNLHNKINELQEELEQRIYISNIYLETIVFLLNEKNACTWVTSDDNIMVTNEKGGNNKNAYKKRSSRKI